MKEVYNFIERLDIKSEYIVVAVSGGPDSMFLLRLLQDRLDKKIVVAHVHHNLRKESDDEALKLEEYCKKNNLVFEMFKINKYPNNKFNEENARIIRYNFFDKVIKKYSADILFTAHHGDDLIETILMRLVRGSNLKGYAGIKSISSDRGYIIARPLLYLTKDEIVEKLNKLGMWYAVDVSNNSNQYRRNRFRNKVLPALKEEDKNVHTKFIDFSNKMLQAYEYINKEAKKIKNEIIVNNVINQYEFNRLDDIIKMNIIEDYLYDIYGNNIKLITSKHINIIIEAIKESNTSISLPLSKIGIVEYNTFKVVDNNNDNYYDLIFDKKVKLPNKKVIEIDNNTNDSSNYVIHLNSEDIAFPLHVRCRKNGDVMSVKNMSGTKSVSDIFTDEKVPKEIRNTYPIVTDNNDKIIWIPGIKKSKLDRKKDGKYDIILKYR